MNHKLPSMISASDLPRNVDGSGHAVGNGVFSQKRRVKPRWLRLQRRERKLEEARAAARRGYGR